MIIFKCCFLSSAVFTTLWKRSSLSTDCSRENIPLEERERERTRNDRNLLKSLRRGGCLLARNRAENRRWLPVETTATRIDLISASPARLGSMSGIPISPGRNLNRCLAVATLATGRGFQTEDLSWLSLGKIRFIVEHGSRTRWVRR